MMALFFNASYRAYNPFFHLSFLEFHNHHHYYSSLVFCCFFPLNEWRFFPFSVFLSVTGERSFCLTWSLIYRHCLEINSVDIYAVFCIIGVVLFLSSYLLLSASSGVNFLLQSSEFIASCGQMISYEDQKKGDRKSNAFLSVEPCRLICRLWRSRIFDSVSKC
jgi:hypothetical protein